LPHLGDLTSLGQVDLSANQLAGSIPREFARLVGIWRLKHGANQFAWMVPPELAQLRLDLASFHLAAIR